jgi:hypothetical protein
MWANRVNENPYTGSSQTSRAASKSVFPVIGWHWLAALILVQLTDAFTTQVLVGNGLAKEANSLMAGLVNSGTFIIFKGVSIAICTLLLIALYRLIPKTVKAVNVIIVIFYTGVLLWNFGTAL